MRKRRQKGTGYKYVDSAPITVLPSETVIAAMEQAKLANDCYKFQSLSSFLARLLWKSLPADEFVWCAKERIADLPFDGRAYVAASHYVLDKLTAPENA